MSKIISVLGSVTLNENSPEVSKLLTFEILNITAPVLSKSIGIEPLPLNVSRLRKDSASLPFRSTSRSYVIWGITMLVIGSLNSKLRLILLLGFIFPWGVKVKWNFQSSCEDRTITLSPNSNEASSFWTSRSFPDSNPNIILSWVSDGISSYSFINFFVGIKKWTTISLSPERSIVPKIEMSFTVICISWSLKTFIDFGI